MPRQAQSAFRKELAEKVLGELRREQSICVALKLLTVEALHDSAHNAEGRALISTHPPASRSG